MRQNLSRGVVVAAAATSIMSLYGGTAFADSGAVSAASDSPGVASGNNVQVPVDVPLNACGNTVDAVAALNPAFGNSCANTSGSHGRHAAPRVPARHDTAASHGSGPARAHASDHGASADTGHGGTGHGDSGYGHSGHGDSGYGDSGYGHSGHGDSAYANSGYGDSGYGHPGHGGHGHHGGASAVGGSHDSPGVFSGNHAGAPVDVPVELCGNTVDVIAALNPVFGNACGHEHAPQGHASTPDESCTPPHTPPPVHEQPPTDTPFTPVAYTPPPTVHEQPPVPSTPEHHASTPPAALAETGAGGMLATTAASVLLLAGGTVLYRRNRAVSRP
ncbi:chaplin family protein [Streptomyces sp. NPDC048566]|uniref:chaplin n=1 Tax=Streptomyces sp. NPDC048566 TaxID=3365569 RepID=UPI00371AEFC9